MTVRELIKEICDFQLDDMVMVRTVDGWVEVERATVVGTVSSEVERKSYAVVELSTASRLKIMDKQ